MPPLPLPAARPSPPGLGWADFLFLSFLSFFVLFRFLPARHPLPGRQRPLSPPTVPAAGLHPLPASLTSPRLLLAPALLGPVPSFLTPLRLSAPRTTQGNNPREWRAPKPSQVWATGPARPERPTSGCRTGRSRPRRRRGTRELERGPGEGFLARVAGRGFARLSQAGYSGPAGGAPSTLRGELSPAPAHTWQSSLPGTPECSSETLTRACKQGDGWGWRVNLSRGKENSYSLAPSPKSAPRGPPAAWKPHPAGFQQGCAKYSNDVGNGCKIQAQTGGRDARRGMREWAPSTPYLILHSSEDCCFRQMPRGPFGNRGSQACVLENLDSLEPKQCSRMGMQKHFPWRGFAPT